LVIEKTLTPRQPDQFTPFQQGMVRRNLKRVVLILNTELDRYYYALPPLPFSEYRLKLVQILWRLAPDSTRAPPAKSLTED
jgi:hypothetical protein